MIGSTGLYITFVVGWVIAFITYFSVVIVSGVQQEGKVTGVSFFTVLLLVIPFAVFIVLSLLGI
mgnify:CR=1 FL=1